MTSRTSSSRSESHVLVQALLDRLQHMLDASVDRVASLCARGDRLDPAQLDAYQCSCYEIAWANAELLAAQTFVAAGGRAAGNDALLSLAFAIEAIGNVLRKLEDIFLDCELDARDLHALATGSELAGLRRDHGSAGALARLGKAVAMSASEVGEVGLDEQATIARDAFRRFAQDVVAPLAAEIHRRDLTVPETLLGPMREMGVFGLSIPDTFGGSAIAGHESTPMMIAVTEALSEASLAAGGSLITRPEILARALLAGGTAAQKAHWLPRLASGDPLCAIAITEPDYGSDVANLSLQATRVDGGWRVNGAKTWCTLAGKAGVLMVVARTHADRTLGHRGLSLLLVEKPSYEGHDFCYLQADGGKLSGRAIPTIGYRGMHSFDLAFEDFFVPDANLVGGEAGLGQGFYLTMAGMVGGRIQTAGRALGLMRAALDAAVHYAKDRVVFGAPLIEYPLTQVKIARMAARFAACRHLAYAVGREIDKGGERMQASLVKLLACRSAELVTREAQQIHGGMGYAEETAASRYFVDARVLSIFEGAEETLALKVVTKTLLDDALARGVSVQPAQPRN